MPSYHDLRHPSDPTKTELPLLFPEMSEAERQRAIHNLDELKNALGQKVAVRKTDQNLLVATWNIRNFGESKNRLAESHFYIAEIMAHFDLIVVQEVTSSLKCLSTLMSLLGSDWEYMVNDVTAGTAGNRERSAYIFNKKRVKFAGLAGEIVLPPEDTAHSPVKQLKRTPYIVGFQAGWKKFSIVNLHLHPSKSVDDIEYRRAEVSLLFKLLKERLLGDRMWSPNLIIAGDFNLYKEIDDPTIQIIRDSGFKEVKGLEGLYTNATKSETFDRLFLSDGNYFLQGRSGVFDMFEHVFREGQGSDYKDEIEQQYGGSKDITDPPTLESHFSRYWRTFQISDHLPVWFELIIDSSQKFLMNALHIPS